MMLDIPVIDGVPLSSIDTIFSDLMTVRFETDQEQLAWPALDCCLLSG